MSRAVYLTHPQVRIDPATPVPDWGLSDIGRARAAIAAAQGWTAGLSRIVASAERKAVETAEILAAPRRLSVEIRPAMHENDRSATGFLPPAEFETVADAFFAAPTRSVRGWERAVDAQARIVAEVDAALADHRAGDVAFVGHGGVGTLLWCALAGELIDRRYDQFAGGGCLFSFDIATRRVQGGWRRIEDAEST
ncbi:MAG: histidine phosphatase family protein [Methylobacteriaceae bacterium]|nr:histidine phosphatase family protein [Methylobacteriaceae bacterium]